MLVEEKSRVASALGSRVLDTQTLAGGYSHETCLVTVEGGRYVVRLGGTDPAIEAAVMARAARVVPVPGVVALLPPEGRARAGMILNWVEATPLSDVLAEAAWPKEKWILLGREIGRVVAGISSVVFDQPGFFADASLAVSEAPAWSAQLPSLSAQCLATTPPRLCETTRSAWLQLCRAHAPALRDVDTQARLVHADMNPKNLLVTRTTDGWRVGAVLDWEFSYSGCPYGDAANMARFGADYPDGFLDGFAAGYVPHLAQDLPHQVNWAYLGRVLDMFALSDLVTRPPGHPIADQAAQVIERWVTDGVPRTIP